MNFSRNGFGMVIVELESEAEFRDQWHQTATRLGYTVEHLEGNDARPAGPAEVWLFRLAAPEDPADRPT